MKNELISIDFMIQNLKNERNFLEKYTRNFQQHFELSRSIFFLEKQKRKLELELIILNNPIFLN